MAAGRRSRDGDVDEPDDVVGGGREEPERPVPATWWRRAALVGGALAVVVALSQAGLLSSDEPAPAPREVTPSPSPSVSGHVTPPGAPRLVARLDGRLLLAARGQPRQGAVLPPDLPADAELVPVRSGGGSEEEIAELPGPVVGVHGGTLFRADADRQSYRDLSPADAVVSAAEKPARILVRRGDQVQEVEASTGSTTDESPFPGFDGSRWTPRGVLASPGGSPLLLTREAGDRNEVALAWPQLQVSTRLRPALQRVGSSGTFLGITDDWALFLGPGCPGRSCTLVVVSLTRDTLGSRPVAPPDGWTFMAGPVGGRTHEAVVPVRELTGGAVALARLVPGGDNALLVSGTEHVRLSAGLADAADGSVYLLSDPEGGGAPLPLVWDPDSPNAVAPLLPPTTFPADAHLVCVCG
jgi:hypothetical protein